MNGTIDVIVEDREGFERLTHIVGPDGKTFCGVDGEVVRQPDHFAAVWCTTCLQRGAAA